ncbi:putative aryl-alcohol dehydrogenase aad14 [Aspergillus melleus]|uniref:putative aryl-alcohol dehydrogenase aad14 n=1 Tax=Aspergillus melleus TaxID=138277 RepID=UPI001E8DE19B|nr:putative aryl-alcohol dehydrogenase aad14 [Aspergillus melleus]KAH8432007.1 putative aryl-alcohol dehydrogenase aad14 [Aspergillus melleus]
MEAFMPAPSPPTELGRYRVLSSTAGIRVSPLQLGAMSIGSAWSSAMGSMDKEASFALLDAFVAAGGNFIDTANNYQNEESETWIGEWAATRGIRDQLVLATKYTGEYKGYQIGKGKTINHAGNHKKSLHMSVRDSLRKLQTEYIDVLYVHWWDYTTSIEEVMDSLHALVQQGKVLYLGICNTPAWLVSAANTYARMAGKTLFSVYQGRWNVLQRDFEREIIPMARQFGMALAPWDAVGGGKFQTKKALEERKASGEGLRKLMGSEQGEEEVRMSEALAKVAAEHGIESVTAIALAYVMSKTTNVFPLVGGRKIEHLQDNIQALSIRLTDEQIAYLESVRPLEVGFPQNMLGEEPGVSGKMSMALAPSGQMSFVKYPRAIGY